MSLRGLSRVPEGDSPWSSAYVPPSPRRRRLCAAVGELAPAAACGGWFPNLPPIPASLGAGADVPDREVLRGYRSATPRAY